MVLGRPAVPRIEDLPESVDLAMLNVPAAAVPDALRALEARGVGAAISIAGGFEAAEEPLRHEVIELMRSTRLRLIGPNCTGVMVPATATLTTMSSFLQHHRPPAGKVAIVSQSGGMGNGLLMSLYRRGGGISHLLTTGDELGTGCLELVAGVLPRDDVEVVGMFIEGITDVAWLDRVSALIESTGKPVLFYKSARTDAGRLAAGGHTGRVVGPADVASALLTEAGLRETRDLEQLSDVLVCGDLFGHLPGGRLGVVTVSGASAVLAADQIRTSVHMQLHQSDQATADRVQPGLDQRLTFGNPLDVGFNETPPIANAITTLRTEDVYDAVIGVVTSLAHDAKQLVDILTASPKAVTPLVVTYLSQEDGLPADQVARLAAHRIAVVPTPGRAVMALDLLAPARTEPVDQNGATADPGNLVGIEGIADVSRHGDLQLSRWTIAEDADGAVEAADAFGYPVVVKAAGRTLHHRSEEGAVAVGVARDQLPDVFKEIKIVADRHGDKVMIQQQAASGFELMLSALDSPEFGPVVIVRPGGVLAELMRDQAVLAGRWTTTRRIEALRRSRIGQMLSGYRGGQHYDIAAVAELAGTLAEVLRAGGFEFIELNPVIVGSEGVAVVDALGGRRSG
jgi:acyl-CoA synthetase (NDP forming)